MKVNNVEETFYDADVYEVGRDYDLSINGLTIEASADKLNKNNRNKTNNIINAIMPFDIENCVKYDANYLKGYTSEKRDVNIEELKELAEVQIKDVARYSANDTLKEYDRGVAWSNEKIDMIGQQWKAAYLPVWLYSYQQVKGDKKILHYVAVNARTKETMGSVPIHMPKLIFVSILVEILGFFGMVRFDFDYDWAFLTVGFIYFFIMWSKYRNKGARHTYETDTKTEIRNLSQLDNFIEHKTKLTNSQIEGANNKEVHGQYMNFSRK